MTFSPSVSLSQGILQAYYQTLRSVQLYGPTNFSLFLDKAIELSSGICSQLSQHYCILLVITVSPTPPPLCVYFHPLLCSTQDGVISDMARTTDRIVAASKLPLSVVIVGVGGADFSNMVSTLLVVSEWS